jgi:hypothetical protein
MKYLGKNMHYISFEFVVYLKLYEIFRQEYLGKNIYCISFEFVVLLK